MATLLNVEPTGIFSYTGPNGISANICNYFSGARGHVVPLGESYNQLYRSLGKFMVGNIHVKNVCGKIFSSLWVADDNFLTTNNFVQQKFQLSFYTATLRALNILGLVQPMMHFMQARTSTYTSYKHYDIKFWRRLHIINSITS